MILFSNISIRRKLYIGFSLIIFTMLALGVILFNEFELLEEQTEKTESVTRELELGLLSEINALRIIKSLDDYVITRDPHFYQDIISNRKASRVHREELQQITTNEVIRIALEKYAEILPGRVEIANQITEGVKNNESVFTLDDLLRERSKLDLEAEVELNKIGETSQINLKANQDSAKKINNAIKNIIVVTVTIILLLLTLLLWVIIHSLSTPLKIITKGAKKLADGNFGYQIRLSSKDELGLLASTLNLMSKSLQDLYEELDSKVREKTKTLKKTLKDFEEQNTELNSTKTAMINLLEDLQSERDKLAISSARDEAILEGIGDGLIVTDDERKVTYVSKSAEKLLKYKAKELLHKKWPEVVINKDKLNEYPIKDALEKGKLISSTKCRFRKKDGTHFPVSITASPIITRNKKTGAIIVFRDITEEKLIDKAKTEFVSLASHQLRTPLSAVNWNTELLLNGDAGPLKKNQKEFIEQIAASNKRMVDLVDSLLNVSRLELGTFSVEPSEFDFIALMKDLVEEVTPRFKNKKQTFKMKSSKKKITMHSDKKLTRIVLENLLTNAHKYTRDKGKVAVNIKATNDYVTVDVKDNGIGIPQSSQKKIFSKLYRAENVLSEDTDGTGLGLYIVKAITNQLQGKISFVSKQNKGTTFTVKLPLNPKLKKQKGKSME